MKEIEEGQIIRLEKEITEILQIAVASYYGLAIVELTRKHYCDFMHSCIDGQAQRIRIRTDRQ